MARWVSLYEVVSMNLKGLQAQPNLRLRGFSSCRLGRGTKPNEKPGNAQSFGRSPQSPVGFRPVGRGGVPGVLGSSTQPTDLMGDSAREILHKGVVTVVIPKPQSTVPPVFPSVPGWLSPAVQWANPHR